LPEVCPLLIISHAGYKSVVEDLFAAGDGSLLQYSTTEGDLTLREYIVSVMKEKGVSADVDEILITSGSQQLWIFWVSCF
jgi:DNA-binding transcriptional MocR family regulator